MVKSVELRAVAEMLKAFANPTRILILQELIAGPKCVTDMEDLLPARQANISQHLTVLRHARLVDFAQDGVLRCYYLARPRLVRDLLKLTGSDEPVVKRTPAQINADKRRLASAKCKPARRQPKQSRRRKTPTEITHDDNR